MERFRNRIDAGQQLATRLKAAVNLTNAVVLGLPRGGVPVAYEVASALNLPLDVCLVRKLGMPGQPELAIGAVFESGIRILNRRIIDELNISDRVLDQITEAQMQLLQQRRQLYREQRPALDVQGRTVIVVDDGIATGSTMLAAIEGLRVSTGGASLAQHPRAIVIAVPVAPLSVCQNLVSKVSQMVCLLTPYPFGSVGLWYQDFSQTTDQEVRDLLLRSLENQKSPRKSKTKA